MVKFNTRILTNIQHKIINNITQTKPLEIPLKLSNIVLIFRNQKDQQISRIHRIQIHF